MTESLTVKKIAEMLKRKEISAQALAESFLDTIYKKDKDIHAFLAVSGEMALRQAAEVDKKLARGEEAGLLAGVPCAVKDNILAEGIKCTAASEILENYTAPYDSTVVRKLKEAGAVILGKTNLDEFAMGCSTENSAFGPTRNPRDLNLVPGGSSGGSAAAVAAGECVFALGSDTGGSIRQPAAFCGIMGLKPTYGAVSRYGLIAMASSMDQIGPLAGCVDDIESVYDAIKGQDSKDSTSCQPASAEFSSDGLEGMKIGLIKESLDYAESGIRAEVEKAVEMFKTMGAEILELSIPSIKYALPAYYAIMPAEASSNLARYDGIRYGTGADGFGKKAADYYRETRKNGFGDEVKRRIILGAGILSSDYYGTYFLKAQKIRNLLKAEFREALEKADILTLPSVPYPPFEIGKQAESSARSSDMFTVAASLTGLPALAMGNVQLMGNYFYEKMIFKLAKEYEKFV